VLQLSRKDVEWILERVKEGAAFVFAAVWIGRSRRSHDARLYVALVFRRDVVQITPRRLLVVDLNALRNGVAYAVVEKDRVLERGALRPDISKFISLQRHIATLDSLCAQKEANCGQTTSTKSRLWRLLRRWENETAKKIVQLTLQYKAAVIADVPLDESIRELKEGKYSAEKKALLNFGRLRRRLRELAEWHGVPYREERLYSTICPICGEKMEELPNRRVKCRCGLEANRDEMPITWAMKRFHKLIHIFPQTFRFYLSNKLPFSPPTTTIYLNPHIYNRYEVELPPLPGAGPPPGACAEETRRHKRRRCGPPPQTPPGTPKGHPGARAPRGRRGN